jgi:hypothetical protein
MNKRWNPVDPILVIKHLQRTASYRVTAKHFGLTPQRVQQIAKKHKIKIKRIVIGAERFLLTNEISPA